MGLGSAVITYAGQPIVLEDPGGELHAWINHTIAVGDLNLFSAEQSPAQNFNLDATCDRRADFERINWPIAPQPRVNRLWFPLTGATRFAQGLFLVGDSSLNKISEQTQQGAMPADLQLQAGETANIKLFMLTPRRLTAVSGEKLWLLPLVDRRFFLSGYTTELLVTKDTTWQSLLASIEGMSTDFVDSVGSDFGNPSPEMWGRRVVNSAVAYDAIASSVGGRFVMGPDDSSGIFGMRSADAASTIANMRGQIIAGGYSGKGVIPESYRLVAPKYNDKTPEQEDDTTPWTKTYPPGNPDAQQNGKKTFYTTWRADIDPDNPSGDPKNIAVLDALANALISAYEDGKDDYEVVFAGVAKPTQNATDDDITYSIGVYKGGESSLQPGPYMVQTRLSSLPYNLETSWNYSQEPGVDLGSCKSGGNELFDFTLDEDLVLATDGVGTLTTGWNSDLPDPAIGLVLKNGGGGMFEGPVGTAGICASTNVDNEYVIIQLECETQPNP